MRLSSKIFAWFVLLAGIPSSIYLFTFARDSVEHVAQSQFEREARFVHRDIDDQIRAYTEMLYALRAVFSHDGAVDRLRFHHFVDSLDSKRRYPAVVSVNYSSYVAAKDKAAFENLVRADATLDSRGYPDFSIKTSGNRSEYFVLNYLEPLAGNEHLFGTDLGAGIPIVSAPQKAVRAIYSGRDSGKPTASASPVHLPGANEPAEAVYLALRLAVYRVGMPVDTVEQRRIAYVGSVGVILDVARIAKGFPGKNALAPLRVRLFDAGPADGQPIPVSQAARQLVFDTVPPPGLVEGAPGQDALMSIHAYTQPVAVGDRIWEVELRGSTGAYTTRFEKSLPLMLMTAGVLSSVLLFGVLYALATSRKRAIQLAQEITKDLRESRAGLADAQAMAQLGSWTFEPATGAMTWSAEMYRIFGLTPRSGRETYADALSSIHELDRANVDAALHDLVETKKGGYSEYRICGPDGEIRWVHIIANWGNHDTPGLVRGTIRDITERKLAGFALKKSRLELQSLSQRLVDLVEVERKRFSTELHDVVGQNITALGLSLQILKTQLASSETNLMRERIDDSLGLVRSTADAVENVLSELRPPMLDDYGLLAALEWYAEKFSTRTGVETIVCGNESGRRMDGQVEIALFRIAQEALNNVAKHAGAKLAEVKVVRSATHYLMSISDDGNGFDIQLLTLARRNRDPGVAPIKERRRERLGMVTMRERARAIGATFNVTSAPNHGTQVEIRMALP